MKTKSFRLTWVLISVLPVVQFRAGADPAGRDLADRILRSTQFAGGLIVHVGCGDGELTAALRRDTATIVHALDKRTKAVEAARDSLQAAGLYGPVTVERWDGQALPYADRMVNLLVAPTSTGLDRQEVLRVLAPGGSALFVSEDGQIAGKQVSKPWPEGLDQWTHFLHDAGNNAVARDKVVGPPGRVQWVAGPHWGREHDVSPDVLAPVSGGGRLFYILGEGPACTIDERVPERFSIVARDAFNGIVLWKRPMAELYSHRVIWGHIPVHTMRRLVVDGDRVYATLGLQAPVTALDAATGGTIREYACTERASEVVCSGGRLVVVTRKTKPLDGLLARRDGKRFRQGYEGPQGGGDDLMAVEQDTGKLLWSKPYRCLPLTLGVMGQRVLFTEMDAVVCLDLDTGTEQWRAPFPEARTLVAHGRSVFAANADRQKAYGAKSAVTVAGFDLETGEQLWKRAGNPLPNFLFFFAPLDIFVAQGLVWALADNLEYNEKPGTGHLLGVDPRTGETRRKISLEGVFTAGHHVRCYKGKATEDFLLFNKRGIEFVPLGVDAGAVPNSYQWVRGVCRYGILPCNGLIYGPSHSCACYPGALVSGFSALASGPSAWTVPERPVNEDRVTRGPAYNEVALSIRNSSVDAQPSSEWPTYRAGPQRSGHTSCSVPAELKVAWQVDVGTRLSSPVVAGDKVLAAAIDACAVHAWHASDGKPAWTASAGARVDSPPTVYAGTAIFGCRDGSVTCVRLSDGEQVWEFQAEPMPRRVGAFGRIESAWPVHGSVLVRDGIVYFAAGRSSFLDGGIHMYGLDAVTGSCRFHARLSGPDPQAKTSAVVAGRMPGALADILSSDDAGLFLRHIRLDWELNRPEPSEFVWGMKSENHLLAGSGFLDDTMFNRTVWRYGPRVDRSQMLVREGANVFGLRVYEGISWNCPIHNIGDGHLIFRQDVSKPVPKPPNRAEGKETPMCRIPSERYSWQTRVPIRVRAMLLVGSPPEHLFVAGVPDKIAVGDDPMGFIEGRRGARLLALDAGTGKELAAMDLEAPPVWDGLASAYGNLFLSRADGKVVCLVKR